MKVIIEFCCEKCGRLLRREYSTDIGYIHDRFQCQCGAIHNIKLMVSQTSIALGDLEEELRGYERWLKTRKGISSGHQYAQMVRRKLVDPNYFPKTLSPIEYFIEYIRERYGTTTAERLRAILL